MNTRMRTALLAIGAALILLFTACGSSTETTTLAEGSDERTIPEPDAVPDAPTSADDADDASEVADESAQKDEATIVVTATTSTTAAPAIPTPLPVSQPGLAAFAVRVFETGELGLNEVQQGCIDGRLQAELRIDRGTEFDTLTIEQQAISMEILIDCTGDTLEDEFLSNFSGDESLEALGNAEDIGRCVYGEFATDDDDQPLVLLAIASMTAGEPAPPESVDAGAALFARCFDLGGLLGKEFASDPTVSSLISTECLEEAFNEENAKSIFAVFLSDPEALDSGEVPEAFNAFLGCMMFGQFMADQFAADGVNLNAAEIACIDEAFATEAALTAITEGSDLPEEAFNGMFACFEPATLTALNG